LFLNGYIIGIKTMFTAWIIIFLPFLQRHSIPYQGTVKDGQTGETLIGATIRLQIPVGTVTDANGFYTLNVPDAQAVLEYSYIGYT
jgi:hypothetical protein